jgi:adenine-specific DNA-methyltransferase
MENLNNKTQEELIEIIKQLKNTKNYGLIWESEVHKENLLDDIKNNHPILVNLPKLNISNNSQNSHIFIEGENLFALHALNSIQKDLIDVIYIDPPFNTGRDFRYNDQFVDSEDGYKHSKWLNFMSSRLKLAKSLLKETGVILVHIDNHESAQLKLLLDDIFGEENFRSSIIWSYRTGGAPSKRDVFAKKHDTIFLYSKNQNKFFFNKLKQKIVYEKKFFGDMPMDQDGNYYAEVNLRDSIEGEIHLMKDGQPYKELNVKPVINVSSERVEKFPTQKPKGLMKYLFEILLPQNGIVLDFFAGSGSTMHSVLELNSENDSNIRSILVTNNEDQIAKDTTYPRIKSLLKEFNENLTYYKVDFTPGDNADPSIFELAKNSIDLLCIKENTHDEFFKNDQIKIYKNLSDHYLIVILDEESIQKALEKLDSTSGSYSFYIFSLGGENYLEELNSFVISNPSTKSTSFPLELKNIYNSLK